MYNFFDILSSKIKVFLSYKNMYRSSLVKTVDTVNDSNDSGHLKSPIFIRRLHEA